MPAAARFICAFKTLPRPAKHLAADVCDTRAAHNTDPTTAASTTTAAQARPPVATAAFFLDPVTKLSGRYGEPTVFPLLARLANAEAPGRELCMSTVAIT